MGHEDIYAVRTICPNWISDHLPERSAPVPQIFKPRCTVLATATIELMKRSFQQALSSPFGLWTGTGLVVAAVATVFLNGSTVLQAVHSPLVTSEHKSGARCVLRVWDANEQLNINTECGERPRRWIWEGSEN